MKRASLLVLSVLCLLPGCVSPRTAPPQSEDADVKVLVGPQTGEVGIVVRVASPVRASGARMGEVQITISNHLEEEVFIEVTGFDKLGRRLERSDANGWASTVGGGGGRVFFPDNTHLLKRLHGSFRLKSGKRATCGCGVAHVKGRLNMERLDLSKWVGADAKVSVPITGYLRKSGKRFSKTVDVPIEIVDGQ